MPLKERKKEIGDVIFHPRRGWVYRFPSLTSRTVPLLHVAGGILLLSGKVFFSFYFLTASFIIHLMDANSYPLFNFLGGKSQSTLLGGMIREREEAPACVFFLSPCPLRGNVSKEKLLYKASFLGGMGLLISSLTHLVTGKTSSLVTATLILVALSGTFTGKFWTLREANDESSRFAAHLSGSLVPETGQVWIFLLPHASFPQISSLLGKYRKLLLGAPLFFVTTWDALPPGTCNVSTQWGILTRKGKRTPIADTLKKNLEAGKFTIISNPRTFDPNAFFASRRGFTSISLTFHSKTRTESIAKALIGVAEAIIS